MTARLNPYLGFRDNARQALEFYASVFGGEPTFSTFADLPMSEPGERDKIMHGQLEVPNGIVLMAADTPSSMDHNVGDNIQVSLSGGPEDEAALRGYWDGLADGATIREPLATAPWGDTFGMLTDKFGIHWLVNIGGAEA